jgi:NitT/TauT family transport system substrate-binding protein
METTSRLSRRRFIALAAALSGALTVSSRAGFAADLPVVTIGTIPSEMDAIIDYGLDLGYFKSAGIDVHNTVLRSGPAVAAALAGGSLDAGLINTGTLAAARSRGVPLKFFASCAIQTPGNDLALVRKDSPIKAVTDLGGKTVGIVAINTVQHAVVRLWLDKAGIDSKSVKFLEVPYPQMQAALEQNRVDVTLPAEPFLTAARAATRSIGDPDDAMPPHYLIFGFAANETWLKANAPLAKSLAAAISRSAAWGNGHRGESAQTLVRTLNLDPAKVGEMLRTAYGTAIDPAQIKPVIDLMVKYGLLDKPVDAGDLIWRA